MCLIVFAWKKHPEYKLILAANRDEFYNRPTLPAHYWRDLSGVLAGMDLKSQGTWLGINMAGMWTAITNYRDFDNIKQHAPSRGSITSKYLTEKWEPEQYLKHLSGYSQTYNGFNLLSGNLQELFYYSNQSKEIQELRPGIYGLSNHLLDTPWPKVEEAKKQLLKLLQTDTISPDRLFQILYHTEQHPDHLLPNTGIGIEQERSLSSIFITMNGYGSRCTTVLLIDNDNEVTFAERLYRDGKPVGQDLLFRFIPSA